MFLSKCQRTNDHPKLFHPLTNYERKIWLKRYHLTPTSKPYNHHLLALVTSPMPATTLSCFPPFLLISFWLWNSSSLFFNPTLLILIGTSTISYKLRNLNTNNISSSHASSQNLGFKPYPTFTRENTKTYFFYFIIFPQRHLPPPN